MAETNLRQANTKVEVLGTLSEKDLKIEKDQNGVDQITGHLTIKVDDVNSIRFNVRQSSKKKDGGENSLYKGLVTVKDEYQSIAEVGAENATKVIVNRGELNLYHDRQTGASRVGFKNNFFNRFNGEDFEPHAKFSVEMFINSMMPEMDQSGEETGRLVVTGWVPTYNGIEQVKLIAPEEIASDVQDGFELGQTVDFSGEIISGRAIAVEIPVKIGKPKIEYKPGKQELVITGASDEYPEEAEGTTPAAYAADSIKAAIAERTAAIEAEKAQASAPKAAPKASAQAKGRSAAGLF